jgi:hypothetical protein
MNSPTLRKLSFPFCVSLLLLVGCAFPSAASNDKHPFGLDDYSELRSAGAIAISPDGKTILFGVRYDGQKGPTRREWHLIDTSGENNRKLDLPETFRPEGFTRDGEALYGSLEVNQKGQLGIVPLQSGKPTQIISLPNGLHGAAISPDGAKFAVLADPRPADPRNDVRHVVENEQTSIYVVSINGRDGAWWCADLKDVSEFAWSADSAQLAVVTQIQKIGHHDVTSAIHVCNDSRARKVEDIANSVSGIAWVNGGKDLAFVSTTTDVLTPDHLWTVSASGGSPVDQTRKLDASISGVINDPHGTAWVQMNKGTIIEVYTYKDNMLQPAYRWPGGIVFPPVFSPYVSATEVLAFTVADPSHAGNVAVIRGADLQRITHEGEDTLAKVDLGEVRCVNWTARTALSWKAF